MSLEHAITKIKEDIENQFKSYEDLTPEAQIQKHIDTVSGYMDELAVQLSERGEQHDASKLEEPELSKWREYIPKLASMKYGTAEYKKASKQMSDVISIHHKANRHHPEYFGKDGLSKMNLIDICELICDWKTASERTNGGDIRRSISSNQERFGYSDDFKQILLNTVELLEDGKDTTAGDR